MLVAAALTQKLEHCSSVCACSFVFAEFVPLMATELKVECTELMPSLSCRNGYETHQKNLPDTPPQADIGTLLICSIRVCIALRLCMYMHQ